MMAVLFFAVALAIDWTVTFLLVRGAFRFPGIAALRERAILSVVISVAISVFLLFVANSEAGWPVVDRDAGMVGSRIAVIAVGFVPIYWLWLYLRGGFAQDAYRKGEDDEDRGARLVEKK